MRLIFALATLTAAAMSAPLAAQEGSGTTPDPAAAAEDAPDPALAQGDAIVVEGERAEIDAQAREQARAITPPTGSVAAPLARMQQPVCPGVFGADEQTAYQIIGRIRANAERIGLEVVRGEPCTANVVVAFVDDLHGEFDQLRASQHYLAEGLDYWDAKRVREQQGAALAWNVTTTRTRDGLLMEGRPPVFASTAISRTELAVREDIEVSVVMIRRDAVADLDVVAIADYATMRALAKTEPPQGETRFGTILELFDETVEAPPYRLTAFDEAYLVSLYRSQANQPSQLALRDVGSLMARGAGSE